MLISIHLSAVAALPALALFAITRSFQKQVEMWKMGCLFPSHRGVMLNEGETYFSRRRVSNTSSATEKSGMQLQLIEKTTF